MKPSCLIPLGIILLGIVSCTPQTRIETLDKDSDVLKQLTSEFFNWRLLTTPEYGTKFGIRSRDAYLEQYTEAAMLEYVTAARQFLQRAQSLDPNRLTIQEGITLDVLKDLLSTYIEGYQYRYYGAYIGIAVFDNPLAEMKKLISWMMFKEAEDYEVALRRFRGFVDELEQKKVLIRLAVKNGTTGSLSGLTVTLETFESFPSNPEETFFYSPFKDMTNISSAGDIQSRARQLIRDVLAPGIQNFTNFLKEEYMPYARRTPSVTSLPGGKEYYRACLKWHLSLNITPKEIYDLGEAEVHRISGNIKKLMAADNYVGDVRSYIAHLKNKSENMFTGKEEMLKVYRETVDRVHQHMSTIMTKVPKSPLIIKSTASVNSATGRYTEPALDGSRPGIFFVNTHLPETRPRFSAMALALHEAEPGHHTQMALAIEEDIPNFRRAIEYRKYYAVPFNWAFYTAYVEGWALYAESLGEELGLYTDPASLLGRYTSEMLRACRLVVDVGLHEYGWSVERAEEYLLTYTHLPLNQIRVEIKRYTDYPGQATAYKIGELTIKRLREDAKEKLGDQFDLRAFHTAVLQVGPVPLSTLETAVDSWVQHQTARAAASRESGAPSCQKSTLGVLLIGVVVAGLTVLRAK